jgi:hypothetical protein
MDDQSYDEAMIFPTKRWRVRFLLRFDFMELRGLCQHCLKLRSKLRKSYDRRFLGTPKSALLWGARFRPGFP